MIYAIETNFYGDVGENLNEIAKVIQFFNKRHILLMDLLLCGLQMGLRVSVREVTREI